MLDVRQLVARCWVLVAVKEYAMGTVIYGIFVMGGIKSPPFISVPLLCGGTLAGALRRVGVAEGTQSVGRRFSRRATKPR